MHAMSVVAGARALVLRRRDRVHVVFERPVLLLQPGERVVEVLLLATAERLGGVHHAHATVERARPKHFLERLGNFPHATGVTPVGPACGRSCDIMPGAMWIEVWPTVDATVEV